MTSEGYLHLIGVSSLNRVLIEDGVNETIKAFLFGLLLSELTHIDCIFSTGLLSRKASKSLKLPGVILKNGFRSSKRTGFDPL